MNCLSVDDVIKFLEQHDTRMAYVVRRLDDAYWRIKAENQENFNALVALRAANEKQPNRWVTTARAPAESDG